MSYLLTGLGSPLDATVSVVYGNGSFLHARGTMQFAVVCVQLTVRPAHELLVSPTAPLADTVCHPAAHLAFPSFTAILHQAWVCGHNPHICNGVQ